MEGFAYSIGDIVCLDPTAEGRGPKGRVMGLIQFDGYKAYSVSVMSFGEGTIRRHIVSEEELCEPERRVLSKE